MVSFPLGLINDLAQITRLRGALRVNICEGTIENEGSNCRENIRVLLLERVAQIATAQTTIQQCLHSRALPRATSAMYHRRACEARRVRLHPLRKLHHQRVVRPTHSSTRPQWLHSGGHGNRNCHRNMASTHRLTKSNHKSCLP